MDFGTHQASIRPSYPQEQSDQSFPTSSAFNSSSSLSSLSSMGTSPDMSDHQSRAFSAPLPSPSQARSQYFGSYPAQASQQGQQQEQEQQQSSRQTLGSYQGQRGDGGGRPETAPFLQDFSLLAEAAKRAQMAVLMRDLGEVSL